MLSSTEKFPDGETPAGFSTAEVASAQAVFVKNGWVVDVAAVAGPLLLRVVADLLLVIHTEAHGYAKLNLLQCSFHDFLARISPVFFFVFFVLENLLVLVPPLCAVLLHRLRRSTCTILPT